MTNTLDRDQIRREMEESAKDEGDALMFRPRGRHRKEAPLKPLTLEEKLALDEEARKKDKLPI